MWMPTRLEFGEGRASGGAIDMPPLDPPGYWTRHVGKAVRVIGGDPFRVERELQRRRLDGGPSGSRTGPYERRGRVTPAERRPLTSDMLATKVWDGRGLVDEP